nr:hAT dimerization domain, ribonuclease H-like domain protein [Tanacetum cinerariifolium]
SATTGDKQKMKQLEEAYEEKKAESNAKEVALPFEAGVGFKKRKGSELFLGSKR